MNCEICGEKFVVRTKGFNRRIIKREYAIFNDSSVSEAVDQCLGAREINRNVFVCPNCFRIIGGLKRYDSLKAELFERIKMKKKKGVVPKRPMPPENEPEASEKMNSVSNEDEDGQTKAELFGRKKMKKKKGVVPKRQMPPENEPEPSKKMKPVSNEDEDGQTGQSVTQNQLFNALSLTQLSTSQVNDHTYSQCLVDTKIPNIEPGTVSVEKVICEQVTSPQDENRIVEMVKSYLKKKDLKILFATCKPKNIDKQVIASCEKPSVGGQGVASGEAKCSPMLHRVGPAPTIPKRRRACRYIMRGDYKRAMTLLYNCTKGFQKHLIMRLKREVCVEAKKLFASCDRLRASGTFQNMENFTWDEVFEIASEKAPLLLAILQSVVLNHSVKSCFSTNTDPNKVLIGIILSIIMFKRNRSFGFIQSVLSIELWTSGCKKEVFQLLNKMGVSLSMKATQEMVEKINKHEPDGDLVRIKNKIEEPLPLDPRQNNDQSTEQDIHPGFTMCWSSSGAPARKNLNKRLWSMAFAAENRVPTLHLTSRETTEAKCMPLTSFLHSREDLRDLKEDLKFCVAEILCQYLPFFNTNFSDAKDLMNTMKHKYSANLKQKSKIINLGVKSEDLAAHLDPMSMLKSLQKYIPQWGSGPVKTVLYGDEALAYEIPNETDNGITDSDSYFTRLNLLEPSPQEFHKRLVLLQDTMDDFYSSRTAAVRGTLYHIAYLFGHPCVKSPVSECFNYVSNLMNMTTECFVILLAQKLLQMKSLSDTPCDVKLNQMDTVKYKGSYLHKVCNRIVSECWQNDRIPTWTDLKSKKKAEWDYCICKTEIEGAEMINCGNSECQNGQWFHFDCVGLNQEDVSHLNEDDDWFCSGICSWAGKKCWCGVDKENEPMITCKNPKCKYQWFHFECVDVKGDNIPEGNWFCSECSDNMVSNEEVNGTENGPEDGLQKYCLALLWRGLNDRARLKAVRTGNGEKMIMYWRLDMVEFFSKKRTKYFMLGHRLLAGINGWLPARLQKDLMWNRTVNYTGEVDRNLEIDFFNEYLNKEFVENLKRGGISFDEDVVKQNAMAWRMKRHLNKIFNPEVGHDYFSKIEGSKDNEEIVYEMLREYSKDELFTEKKGRTVNGLNTISLKMKVKYPNLGDRLRNLSWDLDAERKKALSMIRIPHE